MDTIRVYALLKLNWIRKRQKKSRNQVSEAPREYLSRESHFFRGKRYLLKVVEKYIVVHEMVHLLERKHNNIFIAYMDKFLPKWKFYKEELNQLPVRHERWKY